MESGPFTKTAPPAWLLAFWKEIDDKTFGAGFDCFADDAICNLGVADWHGREAIRGNLRAFIDTGLTALHEVTEYWDGGPLNLLELMFDPAGLRPFVEQWELVAAGLLARAHREAPGQVVHPELAALLQRLRRFPGVPELQPLAGVPSPVPPHHLCARGRADRLLFPGHHRGSARKHHRTGVARGMHVSGRCALSAPGPLEIAGKGCQMRCSNRMGHQLGRSVVLGLGCFATLATAAQDAGTWRAASSTARGVTGDIVISGSRLTLGFSSSFPLAQIRTLKPDEVKAAFDGVSDPVSGHGNLYRTSIPADRRFLHKNTLCGSEETQWVLTYAVGHELQVALFSGAKIPVLTAEAMSNTTDLCGTYGYQR